MRRLELTSLLVLAACGGTPQKTPAAAPTTPAVAETLVPADAVAAAADAPPDEPSAQGRALEACQAAEELLEQGDTAGAVAQADLAYELMLDLPAGPETDQTKQDIRLVVAQVIDRVYRARSPAAPVASRDRDLPLVDNEHVEREVKSFTTAERELFLEAYKRSGRFRPMILKKLEAAGLPSQLSWLPLVESLFKITALSRASALGLWQFISSTGLRYGLRRDEWIDERLDPEKATDAAVAYLSELHQLFGDWQKALAAYNCGETRIMTLQKRSETEYLDFWDLYMMLPDETRRYVPRLIAVLKIVANPEKYGMQLPEVDTPLGDAESFAVARPLKLDSLDGALGLPPGTLASYNPALRHGATPDVDFALRVPMGQASKLATAMQALADYKPPKPQYVLHRVRSGETLSIIAERYRTSVTLIMRFNNLRSANRIWPGQRLRIPQRG